MSTTAPGAPPPPNPAASHKEEIESHWREEVKKQPKIKTRQTLQVCEALVVPTLAFFSLAQVRRPIRILVGGLAWLESDHVIAVSMRLSWIVWKLVEHLKDKPDTDEGFESECIEALKELSMRGSPKKLYELLAPNQPPGDFLTEETAERSRQKLAETIIGKHRELKGIWAAHQQTIEKRWMEKNSKERQKVLTDAWSKMNLKPWLALELWLENKKSVIKDEALYWPGINLEDWSKKKLFLEFIRMRVDYPPDYFARVDERSWGYGHEIGRIRLPILPGFEMEFGGQDTAEGYGKVVPLGANSNNGGRSMHIGHGIPTMKVQEQIYKKLVACCMNLLSTEEKASLTGQGPDPDPSTSPEKGIGSGSSESSTIPVAITNQLCQLPGRPNFDGLLRRVEARLDYVKDHLWALREDPRHFAATLADFRSHETEYWKARMKNERPGKVYTEAHAENDIVSRTFSTALNAVISWDAINKSLQSIRQLISREEMRHIGHRDQIPFDLQKEWYQADLLLNYWIRNWTKLLNGHLEHSPLIRDRKEKLEKHKQKSRRKKKQEKQEKPEEQLKEELNMAQKHQHILAIIEATSTSTIFSVEMFKVLIDRLDAQLKKDEALSQCITPFVQRDISHISLILDCRAHLQLLPWAPAFQNAQRTRPHGPQKQRVNQAAADLNAILPLYNVKWKKTDAWVSEENLKYPVDQKRTKKVVKKLQNAESVLDKFWKAIDNDMKSRKTEWPACLGEIVNRAPERTADWVEPSVKPQVSGHKRARTETKTLPERPSKKAKTKGIADPARALPQEEQKEEPEKPERIYEVNRRALETFDVVFFKPGMSDHPGHIRWSEFVRALNAIGFTHEPNGGSSVLFTAPDHLQEEGGESIDIHAPHDGKLGFDYARRNGRRLERRYGLHHGVFRLKS